MHSVIGSVDGVRHVDGDVTTMLLCRVGASLCAFPIDGVEEIMRPLPVEAIAGTPPFVRGLSIIRGVPTPIIDAAGLLGHGIGAPARVVTLRIGERRLGLAVDAIPGVVKIAANTVLSLPPLLQDAVGAINGIGMLDDQLLLILGNAKVISAEAWDAIERGMRDAGHHNG